MRRCSTPCKAARRVWCAFVFDRALLDPLPRADRRVEFILQSVEALDADLAELGRRHDNHGVRLIVRQGQASDEIVALASELHVQAVYANHDDDPYALARDAAVRGALAGRGVALHTSKDHVVFERGEILTGSGTPYSVFTPYRTAWLKKLDAFYLKAYPVERHAAGLAPLPAGVEAGRPSLAALGFVRTNLESLKVHGGSAAAEALLDDFLGRIDAYDTARDYPAVKGPSYLGVHLRFGTISIRRLAREAAARPASDGARVWLSELVWRDFYQQILHHLPHVVGHSCKPEYDQVRFEHGRHADESFAAWCEGRTGYPLVDAAMAQINQTGWMHNRLRMVAASFLVKDLGIDWRRGEAYFAEHLIDYELASNNGGWQWAASTGCDAQPWFRIFNPGDPEPQVRSAGPLHPPLPAAARAPRRRADPRALGAGADRARGGGRGAGPRLPAADRRPRRSAGEDARPLRAWCARPAEPAEAVRPRPRRRCSGRSGRAGPLPSRACRGSGRRRARSHGPCASGRCAR